MAAVVQDRGPGQRRPPSLSLRSWPGSSLDASLSLDSSVGVSLERSNRTASSAASPAGLPEIGVKQLQRMVRTSPRDTLRLSRADALDRAERLDDSPKALARTLRLSRGGGFGADALEGCDASPTDALGQTLRLSPMAVAPAGAPAAVPPAGSAAEATGADPLQGRSLGEYFRGRRRPAREYYQVRSPEILLPAEGPGNNTTRIYNCGKALAPYQLGASASEPSLPSAAAERGPSPPGRPIGGADAYDPRSARGLVKTVSRVVVQYPEWDPYSLEGRPQRRTQYRAPLPVARPVVRAEPARLPLEAVDLAAMFRPSSGRRGASPDPKSRPAAARAVHGAVSAKALVKKVEQEEIRNISSTISQKGDPTIELAKSMVKMDTLYKMRRMEAGGSAGASESKHASTWPLPGFAAATSRPPSLSRTQDAGEARRESSTQELLEGGDAVGDASGLPPAAERPPSLEEGRVGRETLLTKTLKDLQDTSEALQVQADDINAAQEVVSMVGAVRHATNVVILRSYGVLLRKAYLLRRVELRSAEVAAASTEEARQATLRQLLGLERPPDCLCGLPRFLRKHTHRPGDPIDADRSDFPSFVCSFRLPREHVALVGLREITDENLTYWSRTMHNQAVSGASKEQIEALMDFARNLGADDFHPMIIKTQEVMKDRVADRILQFAEEVKAKDNQRALAAALKKVVPTFGLASKDADLAEQQILAAEEEGVTAKTHPQLATALEIVKKLRENDGERKRLLARDVRRVVRPTLKQPSGSGGPGAQLDDAVVEALARTPRGDSGAPD